MSVYIIYYINYITYSMLLGVVAFNKQEAILYFPSSSNKGLSRVRKKLYLF